jgi:hypothetical protein
MALFWAARNATYSAPKIITKGAKISIKLEEEKISVTAQP